MALTPERYERVQEVFLAARELRGEARERYLDRACAGDGSLRTEVESLLAADGPTEDRFLEAPALGEGFHVGEGSERIGAGDAATSAHRSGLRAQAEEMPERIGVYKLLQKIGEGGFGSVYMAEQEQPVRRRVALKIIKLGMDTKQVIARFEAERQALAMMDHPNIARVLDAGATEGGRPYFVMELVKGVPITEYCDRAGLGLKRRLHLFIEVCNAVQHAHQKGIIHRDIKPSNVMITLHDGRPAVKVIDFGIAKATNQRLTEHTLFTQYGQFIGTPEYMSPEQAEMSGLDVDTRSDIYSLGVLLYELLTGTTPFDVRTLRSKAFAEVQRIIREQEPPRPSLRLSTMGEAAATVAKTRGETPSHLSRLLRGDLDWIILKALEKDRTRRYETANGFAMDVERFLDDEPVTAGPPSASYRVRKFVKRNRVGVAVAAAVTLALVLGIVGTSLGLQWALRERGRAREAQASAEEAQRVAEEARERLASANSELAAQRDEAEHQARLARSVLDYVTGDLIAAVHPDQLGRDATLREWLDSASRSLEREVTPFVGEPEALVSLEHAIGSAYLELSDTARASEHLERGYARAAESLGTADPQTLRIAVTLGRARFEALEIQSSIDLLRAALEVCRRAHPEEIGLRTDLINALVEPLNHLATYSLSSVAREEALRLAHESTALSERAGDGTRLVTSLNRLVMIQNNAGRQTAALEASERAVVAAERAYGPTHAETIRAKRQLAMALAYVEGRRDESMRLLQEAAEATRQVFGTDSRIYLMIEHEVAMQLAQLGRNQESSDAYLEAARNRARVLGPDHTWALGMRVERATWPLPAMGRMDEAREELRTVLDRALGVYGDSDGFTGFVASSLARMCQRDGLVDEALDAWALAVAVTGRAAPGTGVAADYARQYASLLVRLGRREEAAEVLRDALGDDPGVLKSRVDLRSVATSLITLLDSGVGGAGAAAESVKWRLALDAWWREVVARPGTTPEDLDVLARELLGGERAELRDPGAALRVARRAVDLDGGATPEYLGTLLRAQHENGRTEVAETAARLAAHERAGVGLLTESARTLLVPDPNGTVRAPEAIALASRAVERSGGTTFAPLRTLAEAHHQAGDPVAELDAWGRSSEAPDAPAWAHDTYAWKLLTEAEGERRHDAEALRQIRLAFEKGKGQESIWWWRTLAVAQAANGLHEEAAASRERLMTRRDATTDNLLQIAGGLLSDYPERHRDPEGAVRLALRAIEVAGPDETAAYQSIARALRELPDREQEMALWRRITSAEYVPERLREPYAWRLECLAEEAYRDDAEALRQMRLAMASTDDPWIWTLKTYAIALKLNGYDEESRQAWVRFMGHREATAPLLQVVARDVTMRWPERVRDPEIGVLIAEHAVELTGGSLFEPLRTLADVQHGAGLHREEVQTWLRAAGVQGAPAWAHNQAAWRLLTHGDRRDPDGALRHVNLAIAGEGRKFWNLRTLAPALAALGRHKEADEVWRELAGVEGVAPNELNSVAWALMTTDPPDLRSDETALALAERAVRESGRAHAYMLDTLALAQFRAGRVAEAVATQREAAEKAGPEQARAQGYLERLEEFEAALAGGAGGAHPTPSR